MPRPPALLYESAAADAALVDIPSSLSAPPHLSPRCPGPPPATPFVVPAAKTATPFTAALSAAHVLLQPRIQAALDDIRQHHAGAFHRPRHRHQHRPTADTAQPGELGFRTALQSPDDAAQDPLTLRHDTALADLSDIHALPVVSASADWLTLTLAHPHPPKEFHIPPHSSFLLSRFQDSTATFTSHAIAQGGFHFILIDPPWPNRSASRSAAYSTLSRFDVKDLRRLPVGEALVPGGGLVAVWITNKPRVREYVLGTLFPGWGVGAVAEWVWVKVTTGGVPVFALEAGWRKPYEVLVFGRRGGEVEGVEGVREKTVVAVPDVHSRKPGLKELIEPYLPPTYRACEIFGRNLTEGWFTWGDEAIKFNWDGHWEAQQQEGEEEEQGEAEIGS